MTGCWLIISASAWAEEPDHLIWSSNARASLELGEAVDQLVRSRWILIGETHDNAVQHQRQLLVLEALQQRLGNAVLAMEIFDRDDQDWLDDNPALTEIGERVEARGWDWALYRPVVERARQWGWPLQALNLSRQEAMRVARGEVSLARSAAGRLSETARATLLAALSEGHCGHLPADRVDGLLDAQQARDMAMAAALVAAEQRWSLPVVAIAGHAHVRRDYGVPLYMEGRAVVTLAMLETEGGERMGGARLPGGVWDYVWPSPPQQRADPCSAFKAVNPPGGAPPLR